jgi:hypothetical protein
MLLNYFEETGYDPYTHQAIRDLDTLLTLPLPLPLTLALTLTLALQAQSERISLVALVPTRGNNFQFQIVQLVHGMLLKKSCLKTSRRTFLTPSPREPQAIRTFLIRPGWSPS